MKKAVGFTENIIKKSYHEPEIYYALLKYRCTPVASLKFSPSAILMSRLLKLN